jgi:hypothetical protein
MKHLIAVLILFLTYAVCYAAVIEDSVKSETQRRRGWYTPHYLHVQYAGNIGFLSAGIGYGARKDNYQLSLVYGYVMPLVAGVRIHTATAKNIFHIYRFYLSEKQTLLPYMALGLSIELGGRSFFRQPSNMPHSYYDFPKSIHLIPAAGIKLRQMTDHFKSLRGFEFFIETSTVDAYVWYKFRSDEVKMRQILSIAAGVHLLRK